MALSGSFTKYFQGNASRFHMTTSWSATQNITNNTSTITAITTIRPEGAFAATASKNGSITIAGNRKDFTFVLGSVGAGVTKEVGRHTVTVSHASNGTGSAGIASTLDINITYSGLWLGSLSTSGTAYLDTIPRTSSFTIPSSFNVGSAFTVSITRASSSFTHAVELWDGSTNLYTSGNTVGTSASPNIAANTLVARISGAVSKLFTVKVNTYSGSTLIGSAYKTITAIIPASTFTIPSSFNVGSSFTTSISRVSSSLTHGIELRDGSTVIYWNGQTTSTSLSSTVPSDTLLGRMSSVKSKTFTVMLHTYNDSNWIAATSKTITASIPISTFTIPTSFTMGSAFTVSISRIATQLTHEISLHDGSTALHWSGNTIGASGSINVALSTLAGRSPNAMSRSFTVHVDTYNGSTHVGRQTKNITAYVPSTVKPTIETVTASENVSSVASLVGAYVQTKSKLNLAINGAAGIYGSTIRSFNITGVGHNSNSWSTVTDYLSVSGNQTITGTVTDSRNQTFSKSIVVNILPYTAPTLSGLSFRRTLPDKTEAPLGDNVTVSASVKVHSLIVNGVEKNSIWYQVQSAQSGGSFANKANTTSTDLTKSYSDVWSGYSVDHAYNFRVRVGDVFTWGGWSVGVVPTGIVTQQWGSKTTSFGKMIDKPQYNVQVGTGGIHSEGAVHISTTNNPIDNPLVRFYRSDGSQLAQIMFYEEDQSLKLHRYDTSGYWKSAFIFNEDGTIFAGGQTVATEKDTGWVSLGNNVSVRKKGFNVLVHGWSDSIPIGNGAYTRVATLPSEMRPDKDLMFPVTLAGGDSSRAIGRINTKGEISIYNPTLSDYWNISFTFFV